MQKTASIFPNGFFARIRWGQLPRSVKHGLAGAAMVAVLSLFLPNVYRSTASILPKDPNSSVGGGLGSLLSAAAVLGVSTGDDDPGQAYVDILHSRWVAEKVLGDTYEFHEKKFIFSRKAMLHRESLAQYLKADNMDAAVKDLQAILVVDRDPKSGLLAISAETHSPELSQAITHRVAGLLDEFLSQHTRTAKRNKAEFTQERLVEAKRAALDAEKSLREFMNENRNVEISGDPGVRLLGQRLKDELVLKQEVVSTLSLSLEQSLIEAKDDVPILNILDAGNLPIEKQKPHRSILVIVAAILAAFASWFVEHRVSVMAQVFNRE